MFYNEQLSIKPHEDVILNKSHKPIKEIVIAQIQHERKGDATNKEQKRKQIIELLRTSGEESADALHSRSHLNLDSKLDNVITQVESKQSLFEDPIDVSARQIKSEMVVYMPHQNEKKDA